MAEKNAEKQEVRTVERWEGLTSQEAKARREAGAGNVQATPKSKSVGDIFRGNLLTPANVLNAFLAVLVALVGSWKNLLFMGVILCNIVIGIVQELRAKAVIDRLTVVAAPSARTLRDGKWVELPLEELVRGDIVRYAAGDQVGADSVVVEGACRMNEALLTGESDAVERTVGQQLLSGSFVASGHCVARVEHVGAENYAARVTAGGKAWKRPESEIMATIDRIIHVMAAVILPVGIALFVKQWFFVHATPKEAVVRTVAALVGMIPEGLILLTGVVLAVGVVRLAARGALCQELASMEMLARVDTLCLDKTGTLTTGELAVETLTAAGEMDMKRLRQGILGILNAAGDENPTAAALRTYLGGEKAEAETEKKPLRGIPFRSEVKWSGCRTARGESWVLGAAEYVFPRGWSLAETAAAYAAQGLRVLCVGVSGEDFGPADALPRDLRPAGLVVLSDTLRPGAGETVEYFKDQGVALKLISGDDPRTVAALAERVGIDGAERYVDASALETEEATRAAAEEYTVFGRVSPEQKLWLIQSLKANGHMVAMTGDGVNDVLALKESHCSIAMAAGSEAARNVSQVVLMDSDFSVMPRIVDEGRRAINNLQRSSTLFLTKTGFSTMIAICFLFLTVGYPFEPIQLSLISTMTIGIPSFLLALEPNLERVQGRFRDNVFRRAAPGAVAMASVVLWCVAILNWHRFDAAQFSTLCVLLVGFGGLVNLYFVSRPLNRWRLALLVAMTAGFYLEAWVLADWFSLVMPKGAMWAILPALMVWVTGVEVLLQRICSKQGKRGQTR